MIRADALILGGFAVYFAAQASLRIALGGALEVDEAEMLVLARGWQLGYGPQFPLYNWLQVAAFALLGEGTAALAWLKNAVLWLATAGLYLGLRRALPWPQALAGALSLALLPNVIWEFQRASTHSIALLAAICWTVWAVIGLGQHGRWRDYLLFGLILGLGGLSKANYWVVPLVLLAAFWRLPGLPRPLAPPRLALPRLVLPGLALPRLAAAGLIAGLIVAAPYGWMLAHPDLAFASTGKMYRADKGLPAPLEGLSEAMVGVIGGLLVVAIAVALLWRSGRGRPAEGPAWPGLLLARAGALSLGLSLAAVVILGMTEVQARWLVPAFVLLSAGALALAGRRASPLALRALVVSAVVFGLVTLGGMAQLRLKAKATGGIDFADLAALTDSLQPDLVFADYHLGGNLRLLRPGLTVIAPLPATLPPGPASVLLLTRGETPPGAKGAFTDRQLVVPAGEGQTTTLNLPYRAGGKARFTVSGRFLPDVQIAPAPDVALR